jgi:hypothetical protein
MDWIDLTHDREQWRALVNTVMKFRVPWNAGKLLSSCTISGFSRRAQVLVRSLISYLRNAQVKASCPLSPFIITASLTVYAISHLLKRTSAQSVILLNGVPTASQSAARKWTCALSYWRWRAVTLTHSLTHSLSADLVFHASCNR